MNESIVHQTSQGAALNAEHYQTFEMAKANDGIIGGDNIAQIRSYAAFARAQAQAIHKSIATMGELEDVAQAKAEMTETSQTFAKVSVYADQRIGEILRELPKAKNQHDKCLDTTVTKREAEQQAGLSHKTAIDLQAMAANPEIVQAVLDKAEEDGRIPSRKQVLDAINAKKRAESERDSAVREMQEAYLASENMELEVESLKEQLKHQPKPEVVTKEVVREVVPEDVQKRLKSLEYQKNLGDKDNETLRRQLEETRKKLDRAKVLLGEKGHQDNASWDISTLTSATNQYLRMYGGKVWAFDQFERVDEVTQREFTKAITSLAAFAQNIVQYISDNNKLEA
jgi:hypothetical protein